MKKNIEISCQIYPQVSPDFNYQSQIYLGSSICLWWKNSWRRTVICIDLLEHTSHTWVVRGRRSSWQTVVTLFISYWESESHTCEASSTAKSTPTVVSGFTQFISYWESESHTCETSCTAKAITVSCQSWVIEYVTIRTPMSFFNSSLQCV